MSAALVILSGGQDSTTCLYIAKQYHDKVHTITFDYLQSHRAMELGAVRQINRIARVSASKVVPLGSLFDGDSPLTNSKRKLGQYKGIQDLPRGIEPTFVPSRNLLFFAVAANYAYVHKINDIYAGIALSGAEGYPDCRQTFVDAAQGAIRYAMDREISLHTPLIHLSKKQIVEWSARLPGCMEALAYSYTCYKGGQQPCGACHACIVRANGFDAAGIVDPMIRRLRCESTK